MNSAINTKYSRNTINITVNFYSSIKVNQRIDDELETDH